MVTSMMALPLSVTKGLPSFRRSCCLPLRSQILSARSIFHEVALTPKGTTSTGSGNLPSASTFLDWSAITTM